MNLRLPYTLDLHDNLVDADGIVIATPVGDKDNLVRFVKQLTDTSDPANILVCPRR